MWQITFELFSSFFNQLVELRNLRHINLRWIMIIDIFWLCHEVNDFIFPVIRQNEFRSLLPVWRHSDRVCQSRCHHVWRLSQVLRSLAYHAVENTLPKTPIDRLQRICSITTAEISLFHTGLFKTFGLQWYESRNGVRGNECFNQNCFAFWLSFDKFLLN